MFDNEINQLRTLIDKADAAYYSGGNSIVDDHKYDESKRRLGELCPHDDRLTRVGLPYNKEDLRTKIFHPIPMGSLDNTDNSINGFLPWYNSMSDKVSANNPEIFASLKIDGSSIRAKYISGRLQSVSTRGNGTYGEDVTINAINFKYLPLELNQPISCDVRGEAVLYKNDFRTICERDHNCSILDIPLDQLSNPRNVGNGIIARDDGSDASYIRFLAFNIFSDVDYYSEEQKINHLIELGFDVVPHKLCSGDVSEVVKDYFNHSQDERDNLPFEIDGVVVVFNNCSIQRKLINQNDVKSVLRPKHSRAIKFSTKKSNAKIVGVNISVGHTGAIVPTAILETTRVGGVNVTNVLLNNWDEIERFDIHINDILDIGLAGDVIPKCYGVVSKPHDRQPIPEPSHCPSCGKPTTRELRGKVGAVLYCTDPSNCPDVLYGKIDRFIGSSKTGVGILGIGSSTLRSLITNGLVKDAADLYKLRINDIKDITINDDNNRPIKLGISRAKMIINNINDKRTLPLHVFLGSLGIELLGKRRVELLQKKSNGVLDTIGDWLNIQSLNTINIDGLGDTIREAIINGIENNSGLIEKFIANGVIIGSQSTVKSSGILSGYSFCFTGTRECVDEVKNLGGEIKSGVSNGLSFLVQKDPLSRSNKSIKAEQYGTKIISIDYLKSVISGNSDINDIGAARVTSPAQNTEVVSCKSVVNNDSVDDLVTDLLS